MMVGEVGERRAQLALKKLIPRGLVYHGSLNGVLGISETERLSVRILLMIDGCDDSLRCPYGSICTPIGNATCNNTDFEGQHPKITLSRYARVKARNSEQRRLNIP
jgi:hypothetical protein